MIFKVIRGYLSFDLGDTWTLLLLEDLLKRTSSVLKERRSNLEDHDQWTEPPQTGLKPRPETAFWLDDEKLVGP